MADIVQLPPAQIYSRAIYWLHSPFGSRPTSGASSPYLRYIIALPQVHHRPTSGTSSPYLRYIIALPQVHHQRHVVLSLAQQVDHSISTYDCDEHRWWVISSPVAGRRNGLHCSIARLPTCCWQAHALCQGRCIQCIDHVLLVERCQDAPAGHLML